MIRARAAFMACRFDENPHGHETMRLDGATQRRIKQTLGGEHRQLFSEVLVAEDIDLGSRVHTLGFKCAPRQLKATFTPPSANCAKFSSMTYIMRAQVSISGRGARERRGSKRCPKHLEATLSLGRGRTHVHPGPLFRVLAQTEEYELLAKVAVLDSHDFALDTSLG